MGLILLRVVMTRCIIFSLSNSWQSVGWCGRQLMRWHHMADRRPPSFCHATQKLWFVHTPQQVVPSGIDPTNFNQNLWPYLDGSSMGSRTSWCIYPIPAAVMWVKLNWNSTDIRLIFNLLYLVPRPRAASPPLNSGVRANAVALAAGQEAFKLSS